ncbi:unnamed protein product [Rhizophagus irregularis]|nr:unnamed protein product [Rhizophagus irregularis]
MESIPDVPSNIAEEIVKYGNKNLRITKENRWHCVFDRKLHEMEAIEVSIYKYKMIVKNNIRVLCIKKLAIRHKHSQSIPVEANSLISNNANEIYLNKLFSDVVLGEKMIE